MGPLAGYRIIEMAGIGPAPFAAMLLADMGAEVVRVDRREPADLGLPGREVKFDVLHRGRRSIAVDVKAEAGRAVVKRLVTKADAIIEGFRPGVMERLGLGPDVLLALNPKLVLGRMTGFGQDGPLAPAAGHDINYIALAGVLHAIGRKGEAPVPPLNLVGDFGGGGMLLAFGVVCALLEAQRSGKGQVVDAAMVDGSATLMALMFGMLAQGTWKDERGVNVLDTGAPWYDTYATKDGKWLAVGAIERRFYEAFVERLGAAAARPARAARSVRLARAQAPLRRGHRRQDPRRVGAHLRGQRCLRRASAGTGRGRVPPAQRRPSHLRDARRRPAARPPRASPAPCPSWAPPRARRR